MSTEIQYKVCSSCKKKKKAVELFYRNKSRKDGYSGWCKKCADKRAMKYYAAQDKKRLAMKASWLPDLYSTPVGYKRCRNPYCSRSLPAGDPHFWTGEDVFCIRCRTIRDESRGNAGIPELTGEQDPAPPLPLPLPSPEPPYMLRGKVVTQVEFEAAMGEIL